MSEVSTSSWESALDGIHHQLEDVREDIRDVRVEVKSVLDEQASVRELRKVEERQREQGREEVFRLHQDYEKLSAAVSEISTAQKLAAQNMALTQRLNDQTQNDLSSWYERLSEQFRRHTEQEQQDRKRLMYLLAGLITAMVGGFASTAIMVLTKMAEALGAG